LKLFSALANKQWVFSAAPLANGLTIIRLKWGKNEGLAPKCLTKTLEGQANPPEIQGHSNGIMPQ
jgi:hypothetical protein